MSSNKDINRALNEFIDTKFFELHTCIPGKIVSYEGHTTRKARVQPSIKLRDLKNNIYPIDPIDSVPVRFPSTSKFNLLFPLEKDDGCHLFFSEVSLGNYLNSNGQIIEADDATKFNLQDCICVPGLWTFKNAPTLTGINNNDMFLKFQNAQIQMKKDTNDIIIENSAGTIELTAAGLLNLLGATESFVLGDTWKTNWVTFNSTVQTATSGTTAQNASGIETIKSAFAVFAAQLANMLSTKIKGE